MTQRFYEMESQYYGRLQDRWDALHQPEPEDEIIENDEDEEEDE